MSDLDDSIRLKDLRNSELPRGEYKLTTRCSWLSPDRGYHPSETRAASKLLAITEGRTKMERKTKLAYLKPGNEGWCAPDIKHIIRGGEPVLEVLGEASSRPITNRGRRACSRLRTISKPRAPCQSSHGDWEVDERQNVGKEHWEEMESETDHLQTIFGGLVCGWSHKPPGICCASFDRRRAPKCGLCSSSVGCAGTDKII
jgi:hypothetical protein